MRHIWSATATTEQSHQQPTRLQILQYTQVEEEQHPALSQTQRNYLADLLDILVADANAVDVVRTEAVHFSLHGFWTTITWRTTHFHHSRVASCSRGHVRMGCTVPASPTHVVSACL